MKSICFAIVLFTIVPAVNAATQTCIQSVSVPGGAVPLQFPNDCDMEGDLAVYGSANNNSGPLVGGAVQFFREDPITKAFQHVATLQASNNIWPDNHFGTSLDLDGNRIIVGAPFGMASMNPFDYAYVYERVPGTDDWVEQAMFSPTLGPYNSQYGSAVALSGDRACVGGSNTNKVYVYFRNGPNGAWNFIQVLEDSGTLGSGPKFGHAIAMDGDRLVVGAWNADVNSNSGAAFVYTWDPVTETYEQDQMLVGNPTTSPNGEFGWSVAIDGDRLFVSDPKLDSGGVPNSGGGYVFDYDTGAQAWLLTQEIQPPAPVAGGRVGTDVTIRGDVALLGARFISNPGTPFTGALLTYDWVDATQTWVARPVQYLPETPANQWPQSVAFQNGVNLGTGKQRAYFFRDDSPDCNNNGIGDLCELNSGAASDFNGNWVPDQCEALGFAYCSPAVPNTTGNPSSTIALGSPVAADNAITLRSFNLPPNRFSFYLAGQGTAIINQPVGSVGNLCIAGAPIGRLNAIGQVQTTGTFGQVILDIDLTSIAQPDGPVSIVAGETWYFQLWHRDTTASSNFSDALGVLFQ